MIKAEKTYTPNIIYKYITKKFLKTVVLTSIILSLVWLLADSLELSRKMTSRGISEDFLAEMIALRYLGIYLEILPFSILIGSLLCFSSLARTNELIAIRSSGVSVWQFLYPALAVSFVVGFIGIFFINPMAAVTQKKYEVLENKIYPHKTHGVIVDGKQLWLKYIHNDNLFILHANKVYKKGLKLEKVSVYVYDKQNHFIKRIEAPEAFLVQFANNHHWLVPDGTEIVLGERSKEVKDVKIPTQLTPDKIQLSFSSYKTLSVFALPEFVRSLESAGFSTLKYEVMFWNTLFLPLLCMAMFILAAPFAVHFSRKGGVGKLLFAGLCFGFLFYMFNNVILTLAQAGRLNLFIAIIIPILIAGLTGVYMLLHFREE